MLNILHLEDDRLLAELVRIVMAKSGVVVKSVETLAETDEALGAAATPDLILSDLQLAEGRPEETMIFLSQWTNVYPVVIFSGFYYGTRGQRLRDFAAEIGCVGYLNKSDIRLGGNDFFQSIDRYYQRFQVDHRHLPKADFSDLESVCGTAGRAQQR